MSTNSTISGIPLPANTDVINANQSFGDYANGLDSIMIPKFTSTTQRDSHLSPQAGQVCSLNGDLQMFDGLSWSFFGVERIVYKSADTSRASTVTMTADPHLLFTVPAGQKIHCDAFISAFSATVSTGDLRIGQTITGGTATMTGTGRMAGGVAYDSSGGTSKFTTNGCFQHANIGTNALFRAYPTSASEDGSFHRLTFIIDGTTSVTDSVVTFVWSQVVSSATATVLQTGSHLVLRRVV